MSILDHLNKWCLKYAASLCYAHFASLPCVSPASGPIAGIMHAL